jgi:hypothetical protein
MHTLALSTDELNSSTKGHNKMFIADLKRKQNIALSTHYEIFKQRLTIICSKKMQKIYIYTYLLALSTDEVTIQEKTYHEIFTADPKKETHHSKVNTSTLKSLEQNAQ